jgi:hypothetical protein
VLIKTAQMHQTRREMHSLHRQKHRMHRHPRRPQEAGKENVYPPPFSIPPMLTFSSHYLSAIEDRMKRMESAMSANGLSIADPEMEPTSTSLDSQAALSDKLSMFMISDNGKSAFVGASSGFSLFSPQGLNWISQKTGNRDFENIVKSISEDCDTGPVGGTHNFFLPLPVEQREPLPEKEVADMYLESELSVSYSGFCCHVQKDKN